MKKNDQGYCDSTTRIQETIVWFNEDSCTTFQVAKIHARMIKFHQKCFIESIPFEDVNSDQLRHSNYKFRNIHNIENKLTRFQIYPETELACKYTKPLYKTQYSEILDEYEDGFDMNTGNLIIHPMATSHSATDENSYVPVNFQKNTRRVGGKLKPQDTDSTRLKELSLMNNTHFGAIHYDIHLDMKLDYTISIHQHDNLTTDINILILNTHHYFFLTSSIVLMTLTYTTPSEIMTPSPRCICSVPYLNS